MVTLGVSCWAIIRIKSDQTMMVVEVEALIREPVKIYLADFFPLRGGGVPPDSAKGFWAE